MVKLNPGTLLAAYYAACDSQGGEPPRFLKVAPNVEGLANRTLDELGSYFQRPPEVVVAQDVEYDWWDLGLPFLPADEEE